MNYSEIYKAAVNGGCSKEQGLWAVVNLSAEELTGITDELRAKTFGEKVELCAIINARSGCCPEDCTYCSQSAHNSADIEVFDLLNNQQLYAGAERAAAASAAYFGIVTSGATVAGQDLDSVSEGISVIAGAVLPFPCASFGRMNKEQLIQLKDAGIERYHHNLETSERFYSQVCRTHDWQDRVDTVRAALEVGLKVCSGGLFGLGESWEDRADLAVTVKELGVDSVPLNFLHSHPGTPLAGQPPLGAEEALRIVALYRLIMPEVTLRVCGGRPKILGERMAEMFVYGANAFMTGDYLTTSGITPESDRTLVVSQGLRIDE